MGTESENKNLSDNDQRVENEMPAMEETTVSIKTKKGSRICPALTHKYCPGLAVTMSSFGAFTITHMNSGMSMCPHFDSCDTAILVFSQFALIGNDINMSWDIDAEAVTDIIKSIGNKPVPFDSTASDKNGEKKHTIKEWMHFMRLHNTVSDLYESDAMYEADKNLLLCKR